MSASAVCENCAQSAQPKTAPPSTPSGSYDAPPQCGQRAPAAGNGASGKLHMAHTAASLRDTSPLANVPTNPIDKTIMRGTPQSISLLRCDCVAASNRRRHTAGRARCRLRRGAAAPLRRRHRISGATGHSASDNAIEIRKRARQRDRNIAIIEIRGTR